MRPELVDLFSQLMPIQLAQLLAPSWFMFIGLAGVVTLALMLRAAPAARIDRAIVASAILWGYLAAVSAGIVVPMLIDLIEQSLRGGAVRLRWAGMTSFWGFLAGGAAVAIVAVRGGVSLGRLGDLATAPLGIALLFARLGCFVAGCDYGKVTAMPWAVRFPAGSPAWRDQVRDGLVPPGRAESLPVHPTQLYEALLGIAIAVLAIALARRAWARARAGRVFVAAALAYAVGRFGIEMLRADLGRGFFGPLSSGQVFSLLLIAAIGAGVLWSWRRRAVTTVAAVALVGLVSLSPHDAHAQEAMPPGPPPPVAPAAAPSDDGALEFGLLAGVAAPLNRRNDQVPPLAGPSFSAGYRLPGAFSVWVDVDSLGNRDATHGTALVSMQFDQPLREKWSFGPRFGIGSTLVNFDEPAFRDVAGLTMRAEATFSIQLADHWMLWVRPVAFDFLTADDLGGPILTWQFRLGVAYQYRRSKRRSGATPPPPPPPGYPPGYPPAPMPAPAPPPPAPADPMDPYQ